MENALIEIELVRHFKIFVFKMLGFLLPHIINLCSLCDDKDIYNPTIKHAIFSTLFDAVK